MCAYCFHCFSRLALKGKLSVHIFNCPSGRMYRRMGVSAWDGLITRLHGPYWIRNARQNTLERYLLVMFGNLIIFGDLNLFPLLHSPIWYRLLFSFFSTDYELCKKILSKQRITAVRHHFMLSAARNSCAIYCVCSYYYHMHWLCVSRAGNKWIIFAEKRLNSDTVFIQASEWTQRTKSKKRKKTPIKSIKINKWKTVGNDW